MRNMATKRGPKSKDTIHHELRHALRYLWDPIALEANPLSDHKLVQLRVERAYRGRTCSAGLALRAVLREALHDIARDLGDKHPISQLALAIDDGRSQVEAAVDLSLSSEHISRRLKPMLMELIVDRLRQGPHEPNGMKENSD
jgi:hypothetical protein